VLVNDEQGARTGQGAANVAVLLTDSLRRDHLGAYDLPPP
jgi:hypothetical protein